MKKRLRQVLLFFQVQYLRLFAVKPDVVISFGLSIGDDLLCTILAEQLNKEGKKVWIFTSFPELFENNPHIKKVIKKNEYDKVSLPIRRYLNSVSISTINPWYTTRNRTEDRDIIPTKHIVYIMCDLAKVSYPTVLKPNLFLSTKEKKKGNLFPMQLGIQSTGRGAKQHMGNKDWYPERFQQVVTKLKNKYVILQLGLKDDDLLEGVIDLRGKTSIREAAAILSNCLLFIGQVGFLMHLARSVNCKSVIVYGGRERPDQSGYSVNLNLYSSIPCSPCWYWNYCPKNKICMSDITAEDVLNAVESSLESNSMDKEN